MRATLVVIAGPKRGHRIKLRDEERQSIGRGLDADYCVEDPRISPVHMWVLLADNRVLVQDAGKAGIRVKGKLVEQCQLQSGDVVQIGATQLRLHVPAAPQNAELPGDVEDQVAHWLAQLSRSDTQEQAYEHLWKAFFPRLVALARSHLGSAHGHAVDEEDIALDAMNTFFCGVKKGCFHVTEGNETWRLLAAITARRVIDLRRREMAKKRSGCQLLGKFACGEEREVADLEQLVDRRSACEIAGRLTIAVQELMDQLGSDILRQTATLKLQGFSNHEISQRLGCSRSTTKSRLRKIRRKWS